MSISLERNIGLDGMRSIAIMIVLLQHSLFILQSNKTSKLLSEIINFFDGVSIFFVLSGFLIGNILIKEAFIKQMNFNSLIIFWKRRWLRTIPSYYLILSLVLFISLFEKKEEFIIYISHYIFLQNVIYELAPFYPEAWSLSIEEWFYFLFPITILVFLKFGQKHLSILFSVLVFIFIALLFRFIALENHIVIDFRKPLVFRIDAIAFGVLFAYFKFKYESIFIEKKRVLFTFGILLILIASFCKYFCNTYFLVFFYSFEALSYSMMLPFIFNINTKKNKRLNMIFFYFSTRSYLLYLTNLSLVIGVVLPLLKNIIPIINQSYVIRYVLFWVINFAIVEVIYHFFERPILIWRDKYVTYIN